MLKKLTIENIALVERAEIDFSDGLTVLTGETGAGKSVVVSSLSLALGGRAEKEFIRHGTDTAEVAAVFDVSKMPKAYHREFIDYIDNDLLTVERTVTLSGNSKARLSGKTVSLSLVKEAVAPLAEIMGQHAGQALLDESNHLFFLDRFGNLIDQREKVSALYTKWRASSDELKRLIRRRDQLKNERELLLFQRDEIEKAHVEPGEEERLLSEKKILDSVRSLMTASSLFTDILGGEEQSVSNFLSLARAELDKMAAVDQSLKSKLEKFEELRIELDDLRGAVESYGSTLADDPARVEEINLRLDELYALKKKYGGAEESIVEALRIIHERLKENPDVDSAIGELEERTAAEFAAYSKAALTLSEARKKAATKLQKVAIAELTDLAIDDASFEFEFIYEDDANGVIINGRAVKPLEFGLEDGRILFSANKGEPVKSLAKTASGGEISRLFLAIKSAEQATRKDSSGLLVFDEVDAGIGGTTALSLADKLKKLAAKNQVLVITHLHQIARVADNHLSASKTTLGRRSAIEVKPLRDKEIKAEIERMVALPEEV